jgi:Rps23 Pro-64 3,4-dihydroxylase Tpa1-like proline 4-hydroxylase
MLRLGPALDPVALTHRYREKRRLHIPEFLASEDADRVYAELLRTPWSTVFNENERVHRIGPDEAARLSQAQVAAMMQGIGARAADRFQFLYQYDPIFVRYFADPHPWMPIFELYEFLNSPAMLDMFRALTGQDSILWADAQATLFRPGHFLKAHNDLKREEQRVAAYVLNFSKDWQKDWGGYLQFFDSTGNVEQGLKPSFNAINLFTVPADHSVEMVATYAAGNRLAVTGWLRADDPPGAFDRYPAARRTLSVNDDAVRAI